LLPIRHVGFRLRATTKVDTQAAFLPGAASAHVVMADALPQFGNFYGPAAAGMQGLQQRVMMTVRKTAVGPLSLAAWALMPCVTSRWPPTGCALLHRRPTGHSLAGYLHLGAGSGERDVAQRCGSPGYCLADSRARYYHQIG
jgi:hypothetical protein